MEDLLDLIPFLIFILIGLGKVLGERNKHKRKQEAEAARQRQTMQQPDPWQEQETAEEEEDDEIDYNQLGELFERDSSLLARAIFDDQPVVKESKPETGDFRKSDHESKIRPEISRPSIKDKTQEIERPKKRGIRHIKINKKNIREAVIFSEILKPKYFDI